jgi:lysozyme
MLTTHIFLTPKIAQNCITTDTAESVVLNANQYGALVDWAFNEGCGNVGSSTLISRLNAGDDPNTVAEQELPLWVYSDGQELPGLVKRRQAEITLFTTATSDGALPAPC